MILKMIPVEPQIFEAVPITKYIRDEEDKNHVIEFSDNPHWLKEAKEWYSIYITDKGSLIVEDAINNQRGVRPQLGDYIIFHGYSNTEEPLVSVVPQSDINKTYTIL